MALHRINLNLPADLHSRFMATAKREERTLTVILARALEAYIVGSEGAVDRRQKNGTAKIASSDLVPRVIPGSELVNSEATCPR